MWDISDQLLLVEQLSHPAMENNGIQAVKQIPELQIRGDFEDNSKIIFLISQ